MQEIKLFNRNIGKVIPTKSAFFTYRQEKHWFKKFKGFGMNKKVLLDLSDRGIEEIWLFYLRKGVTSLWKAPIKTWIEKGIEWVWDGSYGRHPPTQLLREPQLILNKKHFEVI